MSNGRGAQKGRQRRRPERVSLVYDVHTGGAMQKKELAFLMGVMSDLSGDGLEDLPDVADREFVEITADNFDKVLKGMKPRLEFSVDDKLVPDSEDKLAVDLKFEKLTDFAPEAVARQVDPLVELLEKREQLNELKRKLQRDKDIAKGLRSHLQEILGDEDGGSDG